MSYRAQSLARILSDQGDRYPISVPEIPHDLRLAMGHIVMATAERATVTVGQRNHYHAAVAPPMRRVVGEHPDALWVLDVHGETTQGTASPFAPHHQADLSEELPLRVPDSLVERLSKSRLGMEDDLARVGSINVGDKTLAILGLRTLAALDAEDAERLTWWLPGGDALELRLVRDAAGAWLHLVDILGFADRASAHSGPTALLELARGARIVLVPADSDARGPLHASAPFSPPRSDLMDAWVRYGAAEREEAAHRQEKRQAHPLEFHSAQQRGKNWRVEIPISPQAEAAWLGASVREGRKEKVGQPVAVAGADEESSRFTMQDMTIRGPGLARATLEAQRGTSRLADSGTLEVREDHGAATKLRRERDALETLSAGRAACGRLPLLLRRPGDATPPHLTPLSRSPVETLDADQLRAVQLNLDCRDIVAVQGPPGTGKTRVIVEALRQLATRRAESGEPLRVLVSSVQNEAVANVAERLADAEGLLVRVVQRRARDEDESIDFAGRLDAEREACIQRLRRRLEGFDLQPRLDSLAELARMVDAVRTAATAGKVPAVVRGLARLRAAAGDDLSVLLHDEAARLSELLSAVDEHPTPEQSHPPQSGLAPPASPEELPAWWKAAGPGLPSDRQAEVGFQVSQVLEALGLADSPRRDRRLAKAWRELVPELATWSAAAAKVTAGPAVVDDTADLLSRVDALCVQARRDLSQAERDIALRPKAIALRFLRGLEAEPGAWQRIVENHGGTVAATCSMSAKAALPPGEHYDWVIIDEAGRASPFELLVPMVQGARVVLIGDHRQLPPMIDRNIARRANDDKRVDLDQATLFGEIFHSLPPGCKVRLSTQYRMHGDIGAVVDAVFYRRHNEGLDSWFAGDRAPARTSTLGVLDNHPLSWVDVAPGRQQCSEKNENEARAIVELVRLYANAGADPNHVAVIIPYGQQRELIQKMLGAEPDLARVAQVKTIDAVQGREYPAVIVGLTRTDYRPGFLASPNRINVAISRAQCQLIVVGTRSRFLESKLIRARAPHLVQMIELLPAREVTP